ncbi:omptin family outer membrane protease [Chelatococcus asaccharovorans]|uniref:Plasminogen activator n=1 Tax=Chelatococcus asaccharovorans TaxID=28210 RepID=A0A2V3U7H3_9HYPH|nr:omptin family outer membrane protease [Chelatococcus asaccharovorans]MBS7703890.1 omptin family outer membrane protease [Chelatococcus asaccharovorans]PXW58052.1 plasminogen activator [Chelatococcus asaccharovorans]
MSMVRNAALAVWLVGSGAAEARDVETTRQAGFTSVRWDVSVYSGYLTGQATELVYRTATGEKLSQLNWQIDRALVLGGSAGFHPLDWLTLRLGGWSNIAAAAAMDDFDWFADYQGFQSWTHWSHHDTGMTRAVQFDLNLTARLWQHEGFRLSALGGYRALHFKWKAYGGPFIQSVYDFRDVVGTFPHALGITYRQDWHSPYVGLRAQYDGAQWSLTAEATGSLFGRASGIDHHLWRATLFNDDFRNVRMVGATLAAEYHIADSLSLMARADYQRLGEARGSVTENNYASTMGAIVQRHWRTGAGASLEMAIVSLGLKARW